MFAVTNACSLLGTEAVPVRVEAHVQRGLPNLTIVGLRGGDARDVRERLRCGLAALGVSLPLQRVTISLAPADLPKAGAAFDLPIALALLAAMGEIDPAAVRNIGSQAELGLDGSLRPVLGTMASALTAAREGWPDFFVACSVAGRAAHASVDVRGAPTLAAVVAHLRGEQLIERAAVHTVTFEDRVHDDLSDVRGQGVAAQALEVAAAGGHNLLFFGPPGCGKTMLASRLPTVLPSLTGDEALQVATIHDAAGLECDASSPRRPFRAPHHTLSQQALVGGGSSRALVGEMSLAHRGVLFLDELPEFRPSVIDAMRQPLEQQQVTIRRAQWTATYPTKVQLVAAMNLCRCGRSGARAGTPCTCKPEQVNAYRSRVSGAILDRFDLAVRLDIPERVISSLRPAESSAVVRERVERAWERQSLRWGPEIRNAHVGSVRDADHELAPEARRLVNQKAALGALSGRMQNALVRVSRTIADLRDSSTVERRDVAMAMSIYNQGVGDERSTA